MAGSPAGTTQNPPRPDRRRAGVTSLLAWAGVGGPVLFTAAFLAQEAARRDTYSPLAETVSALEAGPGGWIQQLNFIVFGLLTMAFAVGLHRGGCAQPNPTPGRAPVTGPLLLFISGIGLLLAAAFPMRADAAGAAYDPGAHWISGTVFFLCSGSGLIMVSRALAREPRRPILATYILTAGVLTLLGAVVLRALVYPPDSPLNDMAGLGQRLLILAVLFPARIALSLRLLRVARSADLTQ